MRSMGWISWIAIVEWKLFKRNYLLSYHFVCQKAFYITQHLPFLSSSLGNMILLLEQNLLPCFTNPSQFEFNFSSSQTYWFVLKVKFTDKFLWKKKISKRVANIYFLFLTFVLQGDFFTAVSFQCYSHSPSFSFIRIWHLDLTFQPNSTLRIYYSRIYFFPLSFPATSALALSASLPTPLLDALWTSSILTMQY